MKYLSCLIALLVSTVFIPNAFGKQNQAILIGVENYVSKSLKKADGVSVDAKELGEQFSRLGFKTTIMTTDQDKPGFRPMDPTQIADMIKKIDASCTEEDILVVALFGNGVQFSEENLLETGVRETYFCPYRANLNDKTTLLKLSSVINFMARSRAHRKLLLFDASPQVTLSPMGHKTFVDRLEPLVSHESDHSIPDNVTVFFSCSSAQYSLVHETRKRRLFTYYLTEYFKGNADNRFYSLNNYDINGCISYVSGQTSQYVLDNGPKHVTQVPVRRGNHDNLILGKFHPRQFTNSIGMEFSLIPEGGFVMGNEADVNDLLKSFPDAKRSTFTNAPHHGVTVRTGFYMAKHEVTVGDFRRFVQASGYRTDAETTGKGAFGVDTDANTIRQDAKYTWDNPGFLQTDAHPVVNVSWNDAQEFVRWLSKHDGRNYALPTEAQWEYACRGPQHKYTFYGTAFSNGNDPENISLVGNTLIGNAKQFPNPENAPDPNFGDGFLFTAPVGSYQPNEFGLFDMHGNVGEWCSDWYSEDYYRVAGSSVTDPIGPEKGMLRVVRGGGWCFPPVYCRSASRAAALPEGDTASYAIGFRLISDL